MSTQTNQPIPPQKDVLTLSDARARIQNFQNLMKEVYDPTPGMSPRAIFIPFMDVMELYKLQQLVTEATPPGYKEPVQAFIVGIRAYFTLDSPIVIQPPYNAKEYPVVAVLVAVYQINTDDRIPGTDSEFAYNPDYPTYDLVIPVEKKDGAAAAAEEGYSSIYDITIPCPNLCGEESPLYP